jgi:Fe-S-cluster containining protein
LKNSEIDSIFFSDGYNLAKKYLEEKITIENLLALSGNVYESIDGLMDSFISRCRKEGKNVDCSKGCSICCCQAVLVLPYEILTLFNHLSKNLSDNDIQALSERAHHRDEVTKNMKVMEFLNYKSPCPLLINDSCIAYSARPMACRTYISSSKEGCVKEYHNPADHDIFPDLYEFTIRAGRMINEGICVYLTEKKILTTEWQIESMLITAFEMKDSFERWIAGENVFQKRNYSDEEIYWLNNFGKIKRNMRNS